MNRLYGYLVIFCLAGMLMNGPAAGSDLCRVAQDVAQKGAKAYNADPETGLKLLIQAREMCDEPDFSYNLGIAFYRFGNTWEAEKYLRQAVNMDDPRPVRLNNLASVLLENHTDPQKAVALAEKAVSLDPGFTAGIDTLARARYAAGDRFKALTTIHEGTKKYPGTAFLETTRERITNDYMAHYLRLIKNKELESGLSGLKAADTIPDIALAYCQVLARVGQTETALEQTGRYAARYPDHAVFADLHNELMSQKIQTFYVLFKSGKEHQALVLAKNFSEAHPRHPDAKKAYDDLFEALTGVAGKIEIPTVQTARTDIGRKNGGVDSLMMSIGRQPAAPEADLDLTVDVDVNIPKGRHRNKDAIALLIGNQRYERAGKGLPDVRYAERGVAVMAQYLEKTLGYDRANILVETNVTIGGFNTLLGTARNPRGKLHNYIRPGKSDVFLYYVGHGGPGPKGQTAYLVPVDAAVDYIQNNGYSLDLFYRVMNTLEARHKTIVLDACFSGDSVSGSLFKNISPALLKTATPVQDMAGAAVFCAADKDQVATWYPEKRHSLFTYFFLKGLQGAADSNKDKIIQVKEFDTYLKDNVGYWAKRNSGRIQTPLIRGKADSVIAELE